MLYADFISSYDSFISTFIPTQKEQYFADKMSLKIYFCKK